MSLLEFKKMKLGPLLEWINVSDSKLTKNCETVNREIMIEGKYKIGYLNWAIKN